jgi:hypothetical protein
MGFVLLRRLRSRNEHTANPSGGPIAGNFYSEGFQMSKCKKWSEVLKDDGVIEHKCAEGEFGDCVACEILDWAEELSLAALRLTKKAEEIHDTDGYRLTAYEVSEFEKTGEIGQWPLDLLRLLGKKRVVTPDQKIPPALYPRLSRSRD